MWQDTPVNTADDHLIVLFAVLVSTGVAYLPVGWP